MTSCQHCAASEWGLCTFHGLANMRANKPVLLHGRCAGEDCDNRDLLLFVVECPEVYLVGTYCRAHARTARDKVLAMEGDRLLREGT